MHESPLSADITIAQGDLIAIVGKSWDEIHRNVNYLMHDNWVAFSGRALGHICPGEPHERCPNAPTFEDRSQEETEWQELGAPEAAWKLAKNVFKLKEHEKAAFFSSPENRCHLASFLKPEEREFVVTPVRQCT